MNPFEQALLAMANSSTVIAGVPVTTSMRLLAPAKIPSW